MTSLDITELKTRTAFLSLIRTDTSDKAWDLYQRRVNDLSEFMSRVLSKELEN